MQNLEEKVDNIQEDISKILNAQKEIIERQEDILKDINDLRKEEKLIQLAIGNLETKVNTRYFDLRMFILQKYYAIRRM